MGKVRFDISVSLDGYVAGPDPDPEAPLGQGGEQLHEWVLPTRNWRAAHGMEILLDVLAARLEIGKQRNAVAGALKIVERQRNPRRALWKCRNREP